MGSPICDNHFYFIYRAVREHGGFLHDMRGGKCSTRKVFDTETVRQFRVSSGWVLSLSDNFPVGQLPCRTTSCCVLSRVPLKRFTKISNAQLLVPHKKMAPQFVKSNRIIFYCAGTLWCCCEGCVQLCRKNECHLI